LTGIDNKSGVFNNTPMHSYLQNYINEGYKVSRKIDYACVDAVSGNYVTFNETNSKPVKAILSSASIPFAFPPQIWEDGVVCMDGGSTWDTNLVSAA